MASISDIRRLETKLEDAKERRAKAKGNQEAIQNRWQASFGFSTLKEAEEHLETLKGRMSSISTRLDENVESLQRLMGSM